MYHLINYLSRKVKFSSFDTLKFCLITIQIINFPKEQFVSYYCLKYLLISQKTVLTP